MKAYDHKKIEKKWQKEWEKSGIYRSIEDSKKPKSYILDMFPYPSGEGLHVGHPKGYIATDIFSRHKRMQGYSVLHPMGWDAFGLPAENFAIKTKIHPRIAVEKNIARFKEQLEMIGLDYDWDREINTTDPEFYKWTQWIFLKLLEKGLAYESNEPINWCPTCQTGLSNEDLDGNQCERCGTIVERRPMRQWILKITDYADRMLKDLELLPEWQEHIKESQRNWIGRSEGAEIDFHLVGESLKDDSRFLILHGREGTPDENFIPWLKKELKSRGHEVEVPLLPNTNEPNDVEQADFVQKNCTLDEKTVIIGHSFGGVVALRLLERGIKVRRVVLAATPSSGVFKDGKVRPTVTEALQKGFDFDAIKKCAKTIMVLPDLNDTVVPLSDADIYEEKLNAMFIRGVSSERHFTGKKEPDLLMACIPTIRVFTTRADTLFGATYLVLAPEHPWVMMALKHGTVLKNNAEVAKYVEEAGKKTELERQTMQREKTGVKLKGVEAVNPATGEKIPLYVADYVLANYGTGAIMAVPAHDERDYDFAKKFDIPIKEVIEPLVVRTVGVDAYRADMPGIQRTATMAIVKHWSDDSYLALRYLESEGHGFPGGGIEEGETPRQAAEREVREETGYTDLEYVGPLGGVIHSNFYGAIRKKNVVGHFTPLLFRIKSDASIPVSEEERSIQEALWVPAKEMASFINRDDARIAWERMQGKEGVYTGQGILANSGEFDGLSVEEAKEKMTEAFGRKKVTYKIRDWVFSRQRYWGEPIPVIHCEKCGVVPVPFQDLPVRLPEVEHYEPTGTGESPLANISEWVNVPCPKCGGAGKRETNTMPQWAGSSWYYLRYMDPKDQAQMVDPAKEKYWAPVDLYVGGAEHATRHLIYARFWHKFLFDEGYVSTPEPFTRLISVGLIQAEDGRKMSKRYGNVINPDDIVATYGADTLRVYEMFMGPFTDSIAWNTQSMIGARRFLERIWRAQEFVTEKSNLDDKKYAAVDRSLHRAIKKVGEDIDNFKFNTAISQLMILLNTLDAEKQIGTEQWQMLLKILAPFAPHITEELWQECGHQSSIHLEKWPEYDPALLVDEEITIAIQIDGKTRDEIRVAADMSKDVVEQAAREKVASRIEGKKIARAIVVPGRLVNFVLEK